MDRLQELAVLVAVVDHGSLAAASRRRTMGETYGNWNKIYRHFLRWLIRPSVQGVSLISRRGALKNPVNDGADKVLSIFEPVGALEETFLMVELAIV
jgi:hypothetical protein